MSPDLTSLWAAAAALPVEGGSNPIWKALVIGTCAWVSMVLIASVWIRHRRSPLAKKLFWTFVVMLPPLGWMLYLAFFRPPERNGCETPDSIPFGSGGL